MTQSRAAHRYAKAMLDIARDQNILDTVVQDFLTIERAVKESRDLYNLLDRPTVPADTKARLLKAIFEGKVSPQVETFLNLMATKGRSNLLAGITSSFRNQLDELNGMISADVTSAQELSGELKNRIESRLAEISGKSIRATYRLDPDLIGGFTARVGDQMIDASVRHQLDRLQETLASDAATWTPTL